MVSSQGFNALLKLVEEPPSHLRFIFATTEPDKVIGTIRSRTHHYPFRLVPPKILGDYVVELSSREGVAIEQTAVPLVVRAGAGSVRDSLSVLDQLIGGSGDDGVTYELAVALLGYTPDSLLDETIDAMAAGDGATVFGVIDKVVDTGQDPRRFAEDLLQRLRDLVVVRAVPDAASRGLIELSDDQAERLGGQAQRFGGAELTRAADIVSQGLTDMRGATAPRLLLELMCARVLLPGADDTAEGLGARIDRLERRMSVVGGGSAGTPTPPSRPAAASPAAEAPPVSAPPPQADAPAAARADEPVAEPSAASTSAEEPVAELSVPAAELEIETPAAATTTEPAAEPVSGPTAEPAAPAEGQARWPVEPQPGRRPPAVARRARPRGEDEADDLDVAQRQRPGPRRARRHPDRGLHRGRAQELPGQRPRRDPAPGTHRRARRRLEDRGDHRRVDRQGAAQLRSRQRVAGADPVTGSCAGTGRDRCRRRAGHADGASGLGGRSRRIRRRQPVGRGGRAGPRRRTRRIPPQRRSPLRPPPHRPPRARSAGRGRAARGIPPRPTSRPRSATTTTSSTTRR